MCWSVSVFWLEKLWLRMQRYYNIITITSDNRSNPLWSGQILRAALCVHVCGFVGSRTYKGHGTSSVFNMYEKSFVWFLHQVACITYNSAAVENVSQMLNKYCIWWHCQGKIGGSSAPKSGGPKSVGPSATTSSSPKSSSPSTSKSGGPVPLSRVVPYPVVAPIR